MTYTHLNTIGAWCAISSLASLSLGNPTICIVLAIVGFAFSGSILVEEGLRRILP